MAPKGDIIGRVLHERYRLTRTVGTGGMGAVYEAMDERLERRVAVKVLRSRSEGALSEARFAREVRASSRLHHPNIVSVFDSGHFGDADGHERPFLVLEYIDGESLHERLQSARLTPASIEHITIQIARGLAVAHSANVIHGDLKPHNIMLQADMDGSERVQLVDFGLAKLLDEADAALTQTGVIVGSPRYLAPERLHGDRDDARSDLYALGVILYEMLTGRPPFVAKNTPTLMLLHLTEKPAPPQSICARPISDALNRLCLALLEKDPDDRPENAEAVVQWVRRAQTTSTVPDLFDLDDDDDDDFGGGTQTTTRTDGLTVADSGAWGGVLEPELPDGEVVLAWCRAPDLVRFYRDNPREARRLDALVTEVTAPSPWGGVIGHTAPGSYFYIFPYMKPALEWALTVQRELLHAAYTERILERPPFAPVVEGDEVIYRGVRLAVALLRDDTTRRKDRWTGRTRFFGPAVAQVEAWAKRIDPGETAVVGGVDEALCTAMNARSLGVTDELTQSLYARIVPAELSARAMGGETQQNPRAEGPDDTLVGRDADIKRLAKKLHTTRLVSLIGAAGAGKSALARHMARVDPRGSISVELSSAQGRPDIEAAVAAAFGWVGPGQEQRDIAGAIASEAPGLVVLDNCEHVLAELTPFVNEALAHNAAFTLLLTSRVPLGLPSELRHEVAPLDVDAAAALFCGLCERQGHPVRADENDDVRLLVQRLDGLPLAVELAAGRASVLRAKDIVARLDSDMGILRRTGSHTGSGLERQATLDQALDWSWTLLDEAERHAFIQCSVFGGGFDLEAAEAVLDLSLAADAPSVLDLLQSLREKSLLHTQPGADIRFYIYKTLTSFLQSKGQRESWRGLLETVERRHARYYIDRARELWAGRRGLSSKTVMEALTREEENLRRVVDRFAERAPGWALSAAFLSARSTPAGVWAPNAPNCCNGFEPGPSMQATAPSIFPTWRRWRWLSATSMRRCAPTNSGTRRQNARVTSSCVSTSWWASRERTSTC